MSLNTSGDAVKPNSRRSLLFVPADSEKKLEKAKSSEADLLIFDLEDSVAVSNKPAARVLAADFLGHERTGKELYVRVNALDTGVTLADLTAIMAAKPDGIMLPKCTGAHDIEVVSRWLEAFEAMHSTAPGSTKIIPIVTETATSLANIYSYIGCSNRVWGMLWGAEDLAGDIGASANKIGTEYRSPFRWVREQFLLAAKAAQLVAIDAVYVDFKDDAGLLQETEQARIDGFEAKAAIHPAQCVSINSSFSPSDAEISWARRVMNALESASGFGVATLDGKMIDKPHISQAQKILAKA